MPVVVFFAVVMLADEVFKECTSEVTGHSCPFKSFVFIAFQFVTFAVFIVTILHNQSYSMCLKKDVDDNIFNCST